MTPQFTAEDVTAACNEAFRELLQDLPEEIRVRLRCRRTAERHGSETRFLLVQIWDKNQPSILSKQHFSYSFGYDPTGRYFSEPLAVQFYANRHRIYDKRNEVIPALWAEMQKAEKILYNFRTTNNERCINIYRHFPANNREELKTQIYQGFLELIPYWHSRYAAVIDNYGSSLTRQQVEDVIAGRKKFQPSGSRLHEAAGQYSRCIPARLRAEVLSRDGGRCLKCGSTVDLHIDHILPVSLGGLTILGNLQTLCSAENLSKGNRETTDYRKTQKTP